MSWVHCKLNWMAQVPYKAIRFHHSLGSMRDPSLQASHFHFFHRALLNTLMIKVGTLLV